MLYNKHPILKRINDADSYVDLFIDADSYKYTNISIDTDFHITNSTNQLILSMLSYFEFDRPTWKELANTLLTIMSSVS